MKYLVPQRDRFDAIAVSTLRDKFLVEIWGGRGWTPDPRTPPEPARNARGRGTRRRAGRSRRRR